MLPRTWYFEEAADEACRCRTGAGEDGDGPANDVDDDDDDDESPVVAGVSIFNGAPRSPRGGCAQWLSFACEGRCSPWLNK